MLIRDEIKYVHPDESFSVDLMEQTRCIVCIQDIAFKVLNENRIRGCFEEQPFAGSILYLR
jgi:hypothetical protein